MWLAATEAEAFADAKDDGAETRWPVQPAMQLSTAKASIPDATRLAVSPRLDIRAEAAFPLVQPITTAPFLATPILSL